MKPHPRMVIDEGSGAGGRIQRRQRSDPRDDVPVLAYHVHRTGFPLNVPCQR
jgi:hypothetical protein